MDRPNKNCKYYKKKEKARYFMGVDMSGGGYCTKGYCECYTKHFNRQYVTYIEGRNKKPFKSIWAQRRIRKSTK